jgi:hypothetical protein
LFSILRSRWLALPAEGKVPWKRFERNSSEKK